MIGAIIFGCLATFFCCCVICSFKSLKLAIDVIDASADFLAGTKRIVLVPILYFFLILIAIMVWSGAVACVMSMGKITADDIIPQGKNVEWGENTSYMLWFMLFGILWITAWLEYTCNIVVMISASTYYFNSNANEEGAADVSLGFSIAYTYHMGSVAFGSFIIALVRFIRIVFLYLAKQAQKSSGDNPVVKGVVQCANCVLACIEKICDYINSAAFAYMAVSGDNFCSSAWNGFLLNIKHLMKFSFANLIAKIFILLGKVSITVANCFSLYFLMSDAVFGDAQEVSSHLGPIAVIALTTYITASIFLGLFDTVVMALMTCLAIDMDLHSGTPAFGPPTFHDSVTKIDES